MKKVLCVLSAILLSVGSFANNGLAVSKSVKDSTNFEILSQETVFDDFGSCYVITTYRTCWTDNSGTVCWEDYDIDEVPCPGNQQ